MTADRDPCPLCGSKLGILPYDREGNVNIRPSFDASLRALIAAVYSAAYDDALGLVEQFFDQPVEALKQELMMRRDRPPVDWVPESAPNTPTE